MLIIAEGINASQTYIRQKFDKPLRYFSLSPHLTFDELVVICRQEIGNNKQD